MEAGKISRLRSENYMQLYQELKNRRNIKKKGVREMNCLSPSILSADFSRLGEQIRELDEAGAQYVHIDVMDGMFVPSISFGLPVIRLHPSLYGPDLRRALMIEEPGRYIEDFVGAGADLITVHAESCKHLDRTIASIKERGFLRGLR